MNRTSTDHPDFPRCPSTRGNGTCMYAGPCLTCAVNRATFRPDCDPVVERLFARALDDLAAVVRLTGARHPKLAATVEDASARARNIYDMHFKTTEI